MAHAVAEWVVAGEVRMPVLVLVYEEKIEGIDAVWVARSIMTDHVSAGSTPTRAKTCLKRTVVGSYELAAKHGKTYAQWYSDQRPAEPRYVAEFARCATEVGRAVNWSREGGNVAMAPA